jgi:hypothetical protein
MKHRVTFLGRTAQSDLARLQRSMRSAEDTLDGLHRFLKVPNVAPRRRVIKGSKKQSLVDDGPSRFYVSAAQEVADNMLRFRTAQRFL